MWELAALAASTTPEAQQILRIDIARTGAVTD